MFSSGTSCETLHPQGCRDSLGLAKTEDRDFRGKLQVTRACHGFDTSPEVLPRIESIVPNGRVTYDIVPGNFRRGDLGHLLAHVL